MTAIKLAEALEVAADQGGADLGKFLAQTGMALNRVASSTMGTLMATALMQAGKKALGKELLTVADLPQLLSAATEGVRTRGKAKLGDKTLLDVLQPASDAFAAALSGGKAAYPWQPRRCSPPRATGATVSLRCATGSAARAGSANALKARSIPVAPLR